MYRHRPRHRAPRRLWRPSPGSVVLVLTWSAIAGLVWAAVQEGHA